MKKLLVVLLTLALCVTSLASCDFLGNLFGGPQETPVEYNAEAAADYVYNLYKNKSVTAADFEVTAIATVAGVKHTVEWSVNTDKVTIEKKNDTTYIVNVDEESPEELQYVLTATVKGGDQTATKTFNLTVPKYALTSFEDYMAAKEGDNVVVKGIVVAINSKEAGNKYNHLFLADVNGKGGYYCYSMATDPIADEGIELGMTVEVSGPVTPYSGMQEIKGGTVRIVDKNKKTVEVLDITEKVANGESLANYVGLPVTIKGVEITGQELDKETSQYLNFKVGDKTAYVRTYVTDFPTTLPVDKKADIDAAHAQHFGWLANATGILVLYNSNPYLIPMGTDCFEYLNKIEKSPEQMVQEAIDNLTIPTFISENTTLELPAVSPIIPEVSFTWSVDKEGYTITDNKIALTVSETPVELKFTVVATCEGKTATKDITVKVALPEMSIEEANKLEDGATVVVVGVVTGIADKDVWSDKYNNMSVTITDDTGSLYLFRIPTKVELGDVIKVTGKMATYNNNRQIAQGATVEVLKVSTSAEATAAEDGTAVVLKGTVSNIAEKDAWSDKYGNMSVTITDAAGTYYLFRISTKVELGDEIVVIGKVGSYKGAKQIAQGSTTIITKKAATEETPDQGGDNTDTPAGNTVDMESFGGKKKDDGSALADTSYAERTNSQGWTAVNSAAINGKDYNNKVYAITLNGKVGAAGKLTSATLTGGLKSVSFKYGFPFSDTQFKLTINVKQGDTVVATTVLEKTALTKETVYEYTWTLETAVEGEFTIEIINESLSASSSNKDRLSIWDLTWEGK